MHNVLILLVTSGYEKAQLEMKRTRQQNKRLRKKEKKLQKKLPIENSIDKYFDQQISKYDFDKVSSFTKTDQREIVKNDMSIVKEPKMINVKKSFGRAKTLQDSVSSSSDEMQSKKAPIKKKDGSLRFTSNVKFIDKYNKTPTKPVQYSKNNNTSINTYDNAKSNNYEKNNKEKADIIAEVSESSDCYEESNSNLSNDDYSEMSNIDKRKAKGIGYDLQKDIVNQIYPKTHIKIHQCWYRIQQINNFQNDFRELIREIINDDLIEYSTYKQQMLVLAKFYLDYTRVKLEKIRRKCVRFLKKKKN